MACVSSFGVRSPRPRFYQELDHCVYRFNVSHHKQKTPSHGIIVKPILVTAQIKNKVRLNVKSPTFLMFAEVVSWATSNVWPVTSVCLPTFSFS